MCFSPQRRAIFRHLNFKKCSDTVSFLAFFTSKCAFRHSGVQFLISPLSSYLRTRRFNRPTFGLTRHTNHWKNTAFRDFSNIWRGCIFFLLTFALLHLLSADFSTLLCFSTELWFFFDCGALSFCWCLRGGYGLRTRPQWEPTRAQVVGNLPTRPTRVLLC